MNTLSTPLDIAEMAQNQAAEAEGREDAPKEGRRLTNEEWAAVMPPFVHLNPQFSWNETELEIVLKFIAKSATGWWYYGDGRYIFQNIDDAVLFKMWADKNPLANGMVEIP